MRGGPRRAVRAPESHFVTPKSQLWPIWGNFGLHLGRSYGGPRDRDRDPQSRFRFRFRFLVPTGESLIQIYDNVTIAWETGSYGQIFSDFASRSRSRFRFLVPTVTEIGQKPSSDLGVSKKISGNHLTPPKKGRNLGGSGGHRDWKRDPQSRFRFPFRF